MKSWIFIIAFMLYCSPNYGQILGTKEYYLQKSKNQRETGFIFLGGGSALIIIGAIVFEKGEPDPLTGYTSNSGLGLTLLMTGLVMDIISVPVLISSHNNARAAEFCVNIQRMGIPSNNLMSQGPALTMRIRF